VELHLEQATAREADYARRAVEAAIAARDEWWRETLRATVATVAPGSKVTFGEPTSDDAHEIAPPPTEPGYL
jgi:hypothetical protein